MARDGGQHTRDSYDASRAKAEQLLARAVREVGSTEASDVVDAILVLAELDQQKWVLEPLRAVLAREPVLRSLIWRWAILIEGLDDEHSRTARRISAQLDWPTIAEYVLSEPLACSPQILRVLRRVNEYVRKLDVRLHVLLLERCCEVAPQLAVDELAMIGATLHPLQKGLIPIADLAEHAQRLRDAGAARSSLWLLDAACEVCREMTSRGALDRPDVIAVCFLARGHLHVEREEFADAAEDLHLAAALLGVLADEDPHGHRDALVKTRALLADVQLAACRTILAETIPE